MIILSNCRTHIHVQTNIHSHMNAVPLLFDYNGQHTLPEYQILYGMYFVVSINVIFEPYKSFKPPSCTQGEDRHMPSWIFFVRNSMPNNFYLKAFWIGCVFLAVLGPKWKVICHFSAMLYFNHINLSSPLSPFQGEIDIRPRGLFQMKFNAKELLLEGFWMGCVFLAALSPKWNVCYRFYLNFCYKGLLTICSCSNLTCE